MFADLETFNITQHWGKDEYRTDQNGQPRPLEPICALVTEVNAAEQLVVATFAVRIDSQWPTNIGDPKIGTSIPRFITFMFDLKAINVYRAQFPGRDDLPHELTGLLKTIIGGNYFKREDGTGGLTLYVPYGGDRLNPNVRNSLNADSMATI